MIVLYHAYYMTTSYNGMCGSFYGDPTFRRILIMAKYDWKDLEDLRDDWFRVFGESMGMGFEITPDTGSDDEEVHRNGESKAS